MPNIELDRQTIIYIYSATALYPNVPFETEIEGVIHYVERLYPAEDLYPNKGTLIIEGGETEAGIVAGTMKLEETIADSELEYGDCISNKFECTLYGVSDNINGRRMMVLQRDNGSLYPIFTGYIDSSTHDRYNLDRTIVAYDELYRLRSVNMADFWNDFWDGKTDTTLKTLREAACTSIGLQYVDKELVNDDLVVTMFDNFTDLSFCDLMRMICELQACFPNVNREGIIDFVTLSNDEAINIISNCERGNAEFEDYFTHTITGITLYDSQSSITQFYPSTGAGVNPYSITGNIFLLGRTGAFIDSALHTLHEAIKDITYNPFTSPLILSDWTLSLGDKITTEKGTSYIMKNSFSGPILTQQDITAIAKGEVREQKANSSYGTKVSGYNFSKIQQDVDGIKTEVTGIIDTMEYLNADDLSNWQYNLISSQLDEKAEIWKQSTNPAENWTTIALKEQHVGDFWQNNGVDKVYHKTNNSGNIVYEWIEQTGIPKQLFSQSHANLYVTPPTTYSEGDIFVPERELVKENVTFKQKCFYKAISGDVLFKAGNWVSLLYADSTQLDSFIENQYSTFVTQTNTAINSKVTKGNGEVLAEINEDTTGVTIKGAKVSIASVGSNTLDDVFTVVNNTVTMKGGVTIDTSSKTDDILCLNYKQAGVSNVSSTQITPYAIQQGETDEGSKVYKSNTQWSGLSAIQLIFATLGSCVGDWKSGAAFTQLGASSLSMSYGSSACLYNQTGAHTSSDRRAKENIEPLDDNYTDLLNEIDPKIFNYIGSEQKHLGFIAQDVEEALPDDVIVEDIGDMLSLNYTEFIPILWKICQKQQEEINELKARLEGINE